MITLLQRHINSSFTLYFNNAIYIKRKPIVTKCNGVAFIYYSLPIKKASNKGGLNKYI